jgi:site-specific recombinase XerD
VEMVREYISYLQTAPKYQGHPYNPAQDQPMSAANVRNHVRVLRSFSSWLEREQYTEGNILSRLKVPKAPRKVMETLSDAEIGRLFGCLDINTGTVCRDAAILMLFLDTGLRCSELLGLNVEDVHLEEQWLKVMGKGQKERMVPFGAKATRLLQSYLAHFRPEPMASNRVFLCVDGSAMSENTIRLLFARLAQKAEVPRLHIHLLRHTFATRYLINGGDAFSLHRLLGHTTPEMTRRYMDMVAVEKAVKKKWLSPMDSIVTARGIARGKPDRR